MTQEKYFREYCDAKTFLQKKRDEGCPAEMNKESNLSGEVIWKVKWLNNAKSE